VRAVSGAVMAIRARAFDEVGGFDERYRLYFEENDFLRRVRGEIAYVPAARCRHLYNQSAGGGAGKVYAESEAKYLRRWGGALIKRCQLPVASYHGPGDNRQLTIGNRQLITEASPLPNFDTAAGCLSGERDVSDDIWSAYRGEVLYMRAVAPDGRVVRTWTRHKIPA
jgi:hypothetical protein